MGGPALARADVDGPGLNSYARARLADQEGALDIAVASYRQALSLDPSSPVVALRSYRQAIEGGDKALALASARILDAADLLPRDGTLLLLADALERKDWVGARAFSARMRKEENFGFLAPIVDSWISMASGPYTPPKIDSGSRFAPLTQRYVDEHLAFQALAQGRKDIALPAIERALTLTTTPLVGLRLAFAQRLVQIGERDRALACLKPDVPVLVRMRGDIARGARLPSAAPLTPAQGVARLFARLGEDVSTTDSRAVSVVLARIATFADPASAELRLSLARALQVRNLSDAALAETAKVPKGSWFALAAADVRVDALMALDRNEEAMTLARALVADPEAGAAEWMRLGNILAEEKQYDAAADAYRSAHRFYADGTVPWTLYLLEGSALERGNRWEDGRKALEQAAALAPDEPVVLNYLGYAQVQRRQNVPAALALLEKASAMKPNDPSITDSLGWALYISGDARGAVPVLEKAAAGAPDDMTINEHLGDALWSVGRRYEARYAWSAANTAAEGADADRITSKVREGLRPEYAAP
ncbi:MAG: hypothetical protein DI547_12615 [Sphingobium sp.]|nr:MAG: hypothetical protein DI547_12615 [Sphingobium sp.]